MDSHTLPILLFAVGSVALFVVVATLRDVFDTGKCSHDFDKYECPYCKNEGGHYDDGHSVF
jgi:hypothetical protein